MSGQKNFLNAEGSFPNAEASFPSVERPFPYAEGIVYFSKGQCPAECVMGEVQKRGI